jgi:hypothetical protein
MSPDELQKRDIRKEVTPFANGTLFRALDIFRLVGYDRRRDDLKRGKGNERTTAHPPKPGGKSSR